MRDNKTLFNSGLFRRPNLYSMPHTQYLTSDSETRTKETTVCTLSNGSGPTAFGVLEHITKRLHPPLKSGLLLLLLLYEIRLVSNECIMMLFIPFMSLPFNIRADLTLSYFVILFFNYLQGLHVQFTLSSSKIHFSSTMRSHLMCHIPSETK